MRNSAKRYGDHFISLVVHQLTHLAEDVRNYGPLDSYAGYKFENFNKSLKRLCKSYSYPLANIKKRLGYRTMYVSKASRGNDEPDVVKVSYIFRQLKK